jgi:kynurenine formamidase
MEEAPVQCIFLGKSCQVVDLSYPLNNSTIFWPGGEGFQLCMNCFISNEYGYEYAAGVINCTEHGGTHVDAPYHFKSNGKRIDEILLSDLIGSCKVIDISSQCSNNRDYTLSYDDIIQFEASYGQLNHGDIVLIRTGWHKYYSLGAKAYLGFDETTEGPYDDNSVLSFPGISKEAANLFVERKVRAVGLDTASLDTGASRDFIAHQILLGNGIYGIENINGSIEMLPNIGATLMVMPMKVTGGSGAPARVVAFFE